MAGPQTKHLSALSIILLAIAACHSDQYAKQDLTLLLTSVENSFATTGPQRDMPLVDQSYLSTFPLSSSVTTLTGDVTAEVISPELPPAPQTTFSMPMQMDVSCLSGTCGDGQLLSGKAMMDIDLDQRLVTLHQFDLRDRRDLLHLSGMIQLRFDDFEKRENALSEAMLSLATPEMVFQLDPDATLLLHEVDLENSHAIVDFEASMTDALFLSGSGIATSDELE